MCNERLPEPCSSFPYDKSLGADSAFSHRRLENTGAITIGERVRRPSLEQCDRIRYLYDYGVEWHFYAILKSVLDDESSDTEPDVVNRKGEPIDQHNPSREWRF